MAKRRILDLSYPNTAGIVESWEDMLRVWHHTFYNELSVDPAEAVGVVITEAPLTPKSNREKIASFMFEAFEAKKVFIANQAAMTVLAAGRTTGVAVGIGDGVVHSQPVVEGRFRYYIVEKTDVAGRVLTDWMQKLLERENKIF
jgi:actin